MNNIKKRFISSSWTVFGFPDRSLDWRDFLSFIEVVLFEWHAQDNVDLSEMHHPKILLCTSGQILSLLKRQVSRHVKLVMLARVAQAVLGIEENSGSHNLQKISFKVIKFQPIFWASEFFALFDTLLWYFLTENSV